MNENIRTIEVNGVTLEVDMRYAKRIDQFKVGDTVKVLDNRNDRNDRRGCRDIRKEGCAENEGHDSAN